MVKIILHIPGSTPQNVSLPDGTFNVGSGGGNQFLLNTVGVSRSHCRFYVSGNELRVLDLGSSNGTFCDGRAIGTEEPVLIPPGAVIRIGEAEVRTEGESVPPVQKKPGKKQEELFIRQAEDTGDEVPLLAVSGIPPSARPIIQEIKKQAHGELLRRLNLKRLAMNQGGGTQLEEKAHHVIGEILQELTIPLPDGVTIEKLGKELYDEAIGL